MLVAWKDPPPDPDIPTVPGTGSTSIEDVLTTEELRELDESHAQAHTEEDA